MTQALRAWLCLAALVLVADATPAWAQLFSPGDLSKPHAKLEGLKACTRCHEVGNQLSAAKCESCHAALAKRIKEGKGFHGQLSKEQRGACAECHREHQGRNFQLIDWRGGQSSFDHKKAGWSLEGAHKKTKCSNCHNAKLISEVEVKQAVAKDPSLKTFLGLSNRCVGCHFDEHRGQEGDRCERCHSALKWKSTPGFNHAKSDFPLRGKHARVACDKCHEQQRDEMTPVDSFPKPLHTSFLKLKDVPHQTCGQCHPDPHHGRFGSRCQSCHNESSWRDIKSRGKNVAFHDKTRFPLRGLHATVDCKACHGPFREKKAVFRGLRFDSCSRCHIDAHFGQLTAARSKSGASCEACHSVDGFVPARYETEDHQKARFGLDGAHQAVPCSSCHVKDARLTSANKVAIDKASRRGMAVDVSSARFSFKGSVEQCNGCHRDVHDGQFGKKPCTQCHTTASFASLHFDHNRDTDFALDGKHAGAACDSCHKVEKKHGNKIVRYAPLDKSCASCHRDVHYGQFADSTGAVDCGRCHTPVAWKPTSFDHNDPRVSAFALVGKHAKTPCERCHPAVKVGDVQVRRYKPIPVHCEDCHTDVHEGAFAEFAP